MNVDKDIPGNFLVHGALALRNLPQLTKSAIPIKVERFDRCNWSPSSFLEVMLSKVPHNNQVVMKDCVRIYHLSKIQGQIIE